MRRLLFSAFLIILVSPALIFAQRDSLRNVFLDAESWFLFEEYADALPLYESLLASDPGNDNLNYKIGICLLNDPYQKDKAIQYLVKASNNINPAYKENSLKERAAPQDALYYLGNAYLVNELLEMAIESYEGFLDVMDYAVYDEELVQAQIRSCKNAQRLKTMPVDMDLHLIDSLINTRYSDIHPVVSGDGTKMAFVTELPFYDGAFFTEKTADGWSYPQMITQMMGFDADVYPVALSYDGTEMILYYDDEYIGNLYSSRLDGGLWTPATRMGENISTKYWESHASFSKDGQSLYFTSNRKGSHGGLDIYLSEKQADGKWGPPVNLGGTINTRYNEECPYISEDGQTLYFSSYGHYNMGGYDVFYSRKKVDGSWAEPVNMGYPINTTDDDLFFQPFNNGNNAYYAIYSPRGIGRHDIYYMDIYSVNNPRLYSIAGNLRTEDGGIDSTRMVIYVIDASSGDTITYSSPNEEGAFDFQLKQGIYELHFKGDGYEELIRPLQITNASNKQGITMEDNMVLSLLQEEVEVKEEAELFEGDESQIKLRQTQVEEVAGIPLVVPVVAPKGSILVVRTYQDSVLISTDTVVTEKRKTELEIAALPGNSEVELELIDKEGNIHRNHLLVVGSAPVEVQRSSHVTLQEFVMELDEEKQDLGSQQELITYLYVEADNHDYTKEDVDLLLAETLAGSDAELLRSRLMENSDSPLNEYLDNLDLDSEGITNTDAFIKHLQEVAEDEGFRMEEVREAMYLGLDEEDQTEILLSQLQQKSQGALQTELIRLDSLEEVRFTEEELFEHLYAQAGPKGYSPGEVDVLLSDVLSDDQVKLFRQHLTEQSDGTLNSYLNQVDLEAEGIHNSEDLLSHLEAVAEERDYSMDEVRKAMLNSLETPLDVCRIYDELLATSEETVREILESIDLRGKEIYTIDQLINLISSELEQKGVSKKEIEKILDELFGEQYKESESKERKASWPLLVLIPLAGAGLIWFIIAWWRRRQNGEKQGD